MDTNSTDQDRDKSWHELIEHARSSPTPTDLDVLPALKRAIEAERYRPAPAVEPVPTNWLEEIGILIDLRWIKPAMGVFAIGILMMGWQAARDWSELMVAWELQIPGITSLL